MPGWIKIHRDIQGHWVFKNARFFKWWVILLMEANHSDKKISLGYDFYTIKRGECAKSIRSWATEFNCGTKAAQNFIQMLAKDDMIFKKIIGKGKQRLTLINITNYNEYQDVKETQATTQATTQGKRKGNASDYTYKEYNNKKEDKEIKEEEIYISFEKFWNAYNYKVGKKNCKTKWDKLSELDKMACLKAIPVYVKTTPEKKFRKHPLTYLNGRHWEDEIVIMAKPKKREISI